jgi:uncharacterized protein YxjI
VEQVYVIQERFFSLGQDSDITDEHGRPVLRVDGKALSLRERLVVQDMDGREVAEVRRKMVSMRPTYEIEIGGEEAARVRKKLFTPFVDRYTVDIPGPDDLELVGDLFEHDYTVRRGGTVVATVSKAYLTMRDTYAVDIAPGEDELLILTAVLALDLAEDGERRDRH